MNKQILAKIKIRTLTKIIILGLFLSLGGSCRSSSWAGTYVGEGKLSSGETTLRTVNAADNSMTIIITEETETFLEFEIKNEKLVKNCVLSGNTDASKKDTSATISFFKNSTCEIVINGEPYKLKDYDGFGNAKQENGEIKIQLSLSHFDGGLNQYLIEFKGKRTK